MANNMTEKHRAFFQMAGIIGEELIKVAELVRQGKEASNQPYIACAMFGAYEMGLFAAEKVARNSGAKKAADKILACTGDNAPWVILGEARLRKSFLGADARAFGAKDEDGARA